LHEKWEENIPPPQPKVNKCVGSCHRKIGSLCAPSLCGNPIKIHDGHVSNTNHKLLAHRDVCMS